MDRHPVQIATTFVKGNDHPSYFVLCEDGSMWEDRRDESEFRWYQLPNLPKSQRELRSDERIAYMIKKEEEYESQVRAREVGFICSYCDKAIAEECIELDTNPPGPTTKFHSECHTKFCEEHGGD